MSVTTEMSKTFLPPSVIRPLLREGDEPGPLFVVLQDGYCNKRGNYELSFLFAVFSPDKAEQAYPCHP